MKQPRSGVELIVTFPSGIEYCYPSIAEAARGVGIARQAIHRYLRGQYEKNRVGFKFKYKIGSV